MQQRPMDKYKKIRKQRGNNDKAQENEVRISAGRRTAGYVHYAGRLLLEREKEFDTVILKASGLAAGGAVQVAEVLRNTITDLHQLNKISTVEVIDEYEPLEEGLDKVQIKRNLAVIEIRLTRKANLLDTKDIGYQAPLAVNAKKEDEFRQYLQRGPRPGDNAARRPSGRGGYRGRGFRGRGENRERSSGNRGGERNFGDRGFSDRGYGDRGYGDRGFDDRRRDFGGRGRGFGNSGRGFGNSGRGFGNRGRGFGNSGRGGKPRDNNRPQGDNRRQPGMNRRGGEGRRQQDGDRKQEGDKRQGGNGPAN